MALPLGELARERLRGRSPFGGAGERSEPERVTVPLGNLASRSDDWGSFIIICTTFLAFFSHSRSFNPHSRRISFVFA